MHAVGRVVEVLENRVMISYMEHLLVLLLLLHLLRGTSPLTFPTLSQRFFTSSPPSRLRTSYNIQLQVHAARGLLPLKIIILIKNLLRIFFFCWRIVSVFFNNERSGIRRSPQR
jgi:hypothetical protein